MSSLDFLIRTATIDDAEQVSTLRKRVDKDKTNKNPPLDPYGGDYPSLEQQISELQTVIRDGLFLVAIHGKTVIGIVSCSQDNTRSGEYSLGFLVDKSWREKKVEAALISQVVQWGQTHSEVRSIFCSFPKSDKAAQHILQEFGFKVVKQGLVVYIQGIKYNATEMSLNLRE